MFFVICITSSPGRRVGQRALSISSGRAWLRTDPASGATGSVTRVRPAGEDGVTETVTVTVTAVTEDWLYQSFGISKNVQKR